MTSDNWLDKSEYQYIYITHDLFVKITGYIQGSGSYNLGKYPSGDRGKMAGINLNKHDIHMKR